MDSDSIGHGFVPRVARRNYRAIERVLLEHSTPTLFGGPPVEVPWAIIDGPWAHGNREAVARLRSYGVKVVVDTQGWRFVEPETWSIAKYRDLPHAPAGPLGDDLGAYLEFFEADLLFQASFSADGYLLPGLIPSHRDKDTSRYLLSALPIAESLVFKPPRPVVAMVGVHRTTMGLGQSFIRSLPAWVGAVYVQFTPTRPMVDSAGLLAEQLRFLIEAGRERLVIGGHLGAVGNLLRAAGVPAADAGLGEGEQFVLRSKLRPGGGRPSTQADDHDRTGGRRYVPSLLRSLSAPPLNRVESVFGASSAVACGPTCCGYRNPDARRAVSREHSLRARVREAQRMAELPLTMRAEAYYDDLREAQATATAVNRALSEAGLQPLPTEYLENQRAALLQVVRRRGVA